MVINEKALITQLKEAYRDYGYTVAVSDGRMMLTNGFWLAVIESDNVPAAVLGMMAEHIRDVPKEGDAFKVTKTKEGPMVQARILEDAVRPLVNLVEMKHEELMGAGTMRRIDLTLGGMQLWQERPGNVIFMIDPRYSVLFNQLGGTVRLGDGVYAQGNISELWVLRVSDGAFSDKLRHLEKIPWVAE